MVTRKVRMLVEPWDRTSLGEQENIIGRTKGEGAALGQAKEFDEIDLSLTNGEGDPTVPVDSHIRLAHPTVNGGARILRRGYNFVDGSDGLGRLNAGLFFIGYQRDPRTHFVKIQTNLARTDALNEYIRHVSSGLFACPPGVTGADDYWGRALFN
jgi:deferrochelatase/peroxidase EfeB